MSADIKKIPEIGQIILRPIFHRKDTKVIDIGKINFGNTDRNSKIFRARSSTDCPFLRVNKNSNNTFPWIALSGGNSGAGMICFCSEVIPDDWILFKVISISKNKNAVLVKPWSGSINDLLAYYKLKYKAEEIVIVGGWGHRSIK